MMWSLVVFVIVTVPPEMMMVIREEEPLSGAPLPQILPWKLLQAIAVIQLYLEEGFIEGAGTKTLPLSLLFQETLSILASGGERTPAALAGRVLGLPPFSQVEKEDYKTLLRFMLEENYLERTEEGGLIVGLEGEKLTSSYKFYASFKDSEDFTVLWSSDEIGTISSCPPKGERFALAGHVWEVEDCDIKRRLIYVRPVKGRMDVSWPGDYGEIHTKILERMKKVLTEETVYPYRKLQAVERLTAARTVARNTGLCERPVLRLGGLSYCFFPWLGTRPFRTLRSCATAGNWAFPPPNLKGATISPSKWTNPPARICRQDFLLSLKKSIPPWRTWFLKANPPPWISMTLSCPRLCCARHTPKTVWTCPP
mgnify:CR=1 FL=1